jgi:hypothetical protein
MNLDHLLNEHFYSNKTSSVWKVVALDHQDDAVIVEEQGLGVNNQHKIEYRKFKERFESGACEFINRDSYDFGSIVKKDYYLVFHKVEANRVPVGVRAVNSQTVDNPLWKYQYAVNDVANRAMGEFKTEYKKPNCECGAHKIGVKDYTAGHSSWCAVASKQ